MTTPGADAVASSRRPLTEASLSSLLPGTLSRLMVVPSSPSTNTRLLSLAAGDPEGWPHLSALVADHQTAGRGRAGREWVTPRGAALTVSFVLRPTHVAREDYGWAPLVVGLATVRALRGLGVGAWLKWPNDVVVEAGAREIPGWGRWRKAVGILCETVPGQEAIVAGIGINVSQSTGELPVPHAASLASLGATGLDRVALMRALAGELRGAVALWDAGAHPRAEVEKVTATLGWDVAVDVPGAAPVAGRAVALTEAGALVVRTVSGDERVVMAGDVRVRRG
ncbi:biotin--[acetyl-CoA-carboxylase] ligase [Demequina mangrovi]|uniref:biotin--[biotin carboxyl-carrier protein] ligase n=1 Tax=Demequina mangrovi TaxID=1043493 RepID=A0A1H6Y7Z2_9MICO|nr:biotin--[acetyl-CoA-carboxylase] ligase [Demequina mangrovi]SEJ32885.1 BirA family transcriptional regulator, biotin operon repressor / biotin-[acetyl-CoA-carboxylase] ligase [Demequina mangrovi]